MHHFTPWLSLAGGALIGASASLLLLFNGRIAGISGIVAGLVWPARREGANEARSEVVWRALFVAGLLVGGLVMLRVRPASFGSSSISLPLVVAAGLLVGVGTRLGGGCTSGHGVCGLARLSGRSLAATCTFMATGMAAAIVVQHLAAAGSGR